MRYWTSEEQELLESLVEENKTDRQIAARLHRSAGSIKAKRVREQLAPAQETGYTRARLARLFGVGFMTMCRWFDAGWFGQSIPVGKGTVRIITEQDLTDFIENEVHWHEWEPLAMTDANWREHATDVRHGLTFLTTKDVGQRLGLTQATVLWRIGKGYIRALQCLDTSYVVRSDWLDETPVEAPRIVERFWRFSALDDAFLRAWRPYQPMCHLAVALARSSTSVMNRCKQLGLDGPRIAQADRMFPKSRRKEMVA